MSLLIAGCLFVRLNFSLATTGKDVDKFLKKSRVVSQPSSSLLTLPLTHQGYR